MSSKRFFQVFSRILKDKGPDSIPKDLLKELTLQREDRLLLGSTFLDQFVQLNWTGPKDAVSHRINNEEQVLFNKWSLKERSSGDECWYELVDSPYLLYLSQLLLLDNDNKDKSIMELLWSCRLVFIEQQLILQKSDRLWQQMKAMIGIIEEQIKNGDSLGNISLAALHLELSHYLLYYYNFDSAENHLHKAQESAGIVVELSGALGRRTKFQEKDVAQLRVKITSSSPSLPSSSPSPPMTAGLPKDIQLDDDTLLAVIEYTEDEAEDGCLPTHLTTLQQAVILGICKYEKSSGPFDRLTNEELEAYLNCVLASPQSWCVQMSALYNRSVLQKGKHRTMERSMTQLQELVDSVTRPASTEDGTIVKRMEHFYCIYSPPFWDIEKQLADVLASMGAALSALEIYERLHLWERVISCYQAAGRLSQAERIIRERMEADGESVLLWCLLGDTTQDPDCYQKAWTLSNERSSRAQKSLGLYYLSKEKYDECVKCLHKSVQINSLQEGVWFTLGHAAAQIDDHALSAKAYRQCVTLEPDNAEAWNNLASAYLKKKDKLRAFNSFQEALKCNYENWKIWENYLLVSIDISEITEAIRSYHRLMDLRHKHLDSEILKIITDSVLDLDEDKQDKTGNVRKKLGELLARSIAETTGNSELWEVASRFHLSSSLESDKEKGIIELQKAQRTSRQVPSWEREESSRNRVIHLTLHYSKVCRESGKKDNLFSARMALKSVISILKGMETGFIPGEQLLKLEDEMQLLTEYI